MEQGEYKAKVKSVKNVKLIQIIFTNYLACSNGGRRELHLAKIFFCLI